LKDRRIIIVKLEALHAIEESNNLWDTSASVRAAIPC
jgi:hypothetical protein